MCESDIYFLKRPDYTAEEWRWLFLTAGNEHYLHSLRLLGFCGVAGINWAVVTRMRERGVSANEHYYVSLPQDACSILHYMRPQFLFLIYMGWMMSVSVLMRGKLSDFFVMRKKW